MDVYKIKDHEGLVKDKHSGAILLSNHAKANEYLNKKKAIEDSRKMASEINTIKERLDDIEQMKDELSDIKSLLLKLAGNGKD